jgi:hypothetical protein
MNHDMLEMISIEAKKIKGFNILALFIEPSLDNPIFIEMLALLEKKINCK